MLLHQHEFISELIAPKAPSNSVYVANPAS